ncbi:MAG: hypothetical protein MHMPM18_000047 [Marteilia pararefringens]
MTDRKTAHRRFLYAFIMLEDILMVSLYTAICIELGKIQGVESNAYSSGDAYHTMRFFYYLLIPAVAPFIAHIVLCANYLGNK